MDFKTPSSKEPTLQEVEKNSKYTELFALARKLEGLHRYQSIHAAGLLESCGLIKTDILGLKTLDVIKHTVDLIRNTGNYNFAMCGYNKSAK